MSSNNDKCDVECYAVVVVEVTNWWLQPLRVLSNDELMTMKDHTTVMVKYEWC